MNTIGSQIQSQNLLKIKKIVDNDNNGDKFVIVRTKKNVEFMLIIRAIMLLCQWGCVGLKKKFRIER